MARFIGCRIGYPFLVVIAFASAALLSGCCGVHKPFETMDDSVKLRPGSVAVISGDGSEATVRLADYLTRELKEKSTFKVMSQEEVGRRVGRYPASIRETKPENENKPVWYAKSEKGKIDGIHAAVNTDYLFLVWTGDLVRITSTSSRGGSSVSYRVNVDGNVIEYPKGKAVGYSSFAGSRSQSCCLFGKSEGEDVNEMLKDAAADMADTFISAARAEKPDQPGKK